MDLFLKSESVKREGGTITPGIARIFSYPVAIGIRKVLSAIWYILIGGLLYLSSALPGFKCNRSHLCLSSSNRKKGYYVRNLEHVDIIGSFTIISIAGFLLRFKFLKQTLSDIQMHRKRRAF